VYDYYINHGDADMNNTAQMVKIASMMKLSPAQAVALPTAVSVASNKMKMTESRFLVELERIGELRDYLKAACIEATA